METVIHDDQALLVYLNNLGTAFWDPLWLFITHPVTWIPFYIFLFYLYNKTYTLRTAFTLMIGLGLAVILVNGMTDFLKHSVQRLRPCHDPVISHLIRIVDNYCGGQYSFSSAHAGNHMAIAMYSYFTLLRKYKYGGLVFLWAIIIGYSRLYLAVHYPLDVMFGFFLGGLLSYGIYRLVMLIPLRGGLVYR